MNFKVIILFLYCVLQIETNESNNLELPDCVLSETDSENIVYNCRKFEKENGTLLIKCENEYRLESLPGQNLSFFNDFKTLRIEECRFGMTEFGNQINNSVSDQRNLNFGSFELPTKIKEVEFADVSLVRLPEYLFRNRKDLTDVKFHENEYNIELPSGLFSNLPQLSSVSITSFGLTYIPGDTFSNSTKIISIDLSNNQLELLPDDLFNGLTNLKELSLQHNKIHTTPSNLFRDLNKLVDLDLSDNQISSITKYVFSNLFCYLKILPLSNFFVSAINSTD